MVQKHTSLFNDTSKICSYVFSSFSLSKLLPAAFMRHLFVALPFMRFDVTVFFTIFALSFFCIPYLPEERAYGFCFVYVIVHIFLLSSFCSILM